MAQTDRLAVDPALATFDPVRWRFIEALARRSQQHQGEAKRLLDGKLALALAIYRERFEQQQGEARETIARVAEQFPEAGDELQRLFAASDFKAIDRFVARLKKRQTSLADLTGYLAQHSAPAGDDRSAQAPGSRGELKAMRYFRKTWSTLAVARQLTQAIEQAPENAGPLNSHRLVLGSLALMRDISPDYLERFMSYVDTLLWLDQASAKDKPMAKLAAKTKK
ncbi:MAG: hypothetical protein H6R17_2117 [Proteobacteria bacterium]|nr:hypothetical protein [Pseudomonadota bacterium]